MVADQGIVGAGSVDSDPEETAEWVESFDQLVDVRGSERAREVLGRLLARAGGRSVGLPVL